MPDLTTLLEPLAGDAPCGADLEYDPAFQAMQLAAAGKPEVQYGGTVIPGEPPDWRAVLEHAEALSARTRDIRVVILMVRALARLQGAAPALQALQLLNGLAQSQWDGVHPQLDASDNNDPTARATAFAALADAVGTLADLRAATLAPARGSLTLRDIELALGAAEPYTGESPPSVDGAVQALRDAIGREPALADAARGAAESMQALSQWLLDKLGVQVAPDLGAVRKLTGALADAAARAVGQAEGSPAALAGASAATPAARGAVAVPGSIQTREDAIQALGKVCEWLERHEPSHPAPLLIRRAQRLLNKNFLDIIRDLMPDGLDQVERLAGPQAEQG
jgi:type VI secretion system protein ImpA